MTRRTFISDMLKCGIATTFLPGAGRIWKPKYEPIIPEFGSMWVSPFWFETFPWARGTSKEYDAVLHLMRYGKIGTTRDFFGDV